ncbi:MAG: sulfatase [Pirellulales bacterium]|nr:sulfatase [Pirellulales bacterium]
MPDRTLSLFIIALTLAGTAFADDSKGTNRYNVLFIAIDDLRPELGCYGVAAAQSPSLDQFAADGVLFRNHYVQVPTCGASRYALMTGRSPARSRALGNGALYGGKTAIKAEEQPGAQTLPELFRRSGYHTTCIGKISHQPDGRVFAYNGKGDGRHEMPGAWDALLTPFGAWKRGWGTFFAYAEGRHREDGEGNRDLMEFVAEKDTDLPDGMMAETAIDTLKAYKKNGKRFFLGLGFFKPHLPFVAPKQDWDAFADADISLPPKGKIASPYWHASGEFYKYRAPFEKTRPLATEAQRTSRRAYLACVRYVDRQVGKVLAALEELELADDTIVVVWGDHGWHLGEQQLWGKHSPFERAIRSVLIVRVPGAGKAGIKTNALAETIDLYPTLVELCRPKFTQTHHELDGVSLAPILTGAKSSVRSAALSYWRDAVSVRTDRYRLVAKMKGGKPVTLDLYDLKDDADSMKNVAADHPEVLERLQQYLPIR